MLRRSYVDVQLVQNAKNLHGKPLQEGCEGLESMKTNVGGVGASERHSASATAISDQTSHDP